MSELERVKKCNTLIIYSFFVNQVQCYLPVNISIIVDELRVMFSKLYFKLDFEKSHGSMARLIKEFLATCTCNNTAHCF